MPTNRLPKAKSATSNEPPVPTPIQCIVGETICNVRVWTEEEWAQLISPNGPGPLNTSQVSDGSEPNVAENLVEPVPARLQPFTGRTFCIVSSVVLLV